MPASLTRRILEAHRLEPGSGWLPLGAESELALSPDHVVFGEASSATVVPAFESLAVERVAVPVAMVCADRHASAMAFKQTVDLQVLQSWAGARGVWFSRPGTGSPDLVHRERLAAPGRLMIVAGRTPPGCGALAMLGLACGELEVAAALAGAPVYRSGVAVLGVRLFGSPGPWVGGQDVALELQHRLAPEGAQGMVVEFSGPGVASLAMADRGVLAAHGGVLGATACLFPSDEVTRAWLAAQGRDNDWKRLEAEDGAETERSLDLDLTLLEPSVAPLEDPAGVRPAHHWTGVAVGQVVIGPRAGYADLALVARVLSARPVREGVRLTIVPGSREIEETATHDGIVDTLVRAGARLSDGTALPAADGTIAGLCFGARPGQLPAGRVRWYLGGAGCCAAAAVTGRLADPRELEVGFERALEPARYSGDPDWLIEPGAAPVAAPAGVRSRFPHNEPVESGLRGTVLIRVGDDVQTDQILPWGARMAPLIGDLPALANHAFVTTDAEFAARARARRGGFVVAGRGFGAGTPRLHAALALLELGVRATLVLSYAPAFRVQLVQAGILPLCFASEADARGAAPGDELEIPGLLEGLEVGRALTARNLTQGIQYALRHDLGPLEAAIARAGGRLAWSARGLPGPDEAPARRAPPLSPPPAAAS